MYNSRIYDYLIGIITAIAGIAGGVLFFNGTLTALPAIIPYFAVISSIIFVTVSILILLPKNKEKALSKCLCHYGKAILFLSIISVVSVLIILSITLAATSIFSIILVGITFAALAGALSAILFLFFCIIDKKCNKSNGCCCNVPQQNTTNTCTFEFE